MTWEIFLGIAALVTFVGAIIGPIIKLTRTISELNTTVSQLNDVVNDTKKELKDHEHRLTVLEVKK